MQMVAIAAIGMLIGIGLEVISSLFKPRITAASPEYADLIYKTASEQRWSRAPSLRARALFTAPYPSQLRRHVYQLRAAYFSLVIFLVLMMGLIIRGIVVA